MLKSKKILFFSLVTSSLLFAEETTKLDEITVSANKMEENIKDVPQSISIITQEDIEQKGIKNIQDVIKEIPNMSIDSINQASFRGLNTSTFTFNNPVVIYLDGVPYYSKYDFNPSLANVEQIEVLRGPQGTLYGKDAIGAVINIVTKTPTNDWKGSIGAEYGNDNYIQTTLNTSGAIADNKLFAGINGSFENSDGWMTNNYQGAEEDSDKYTDRKISGFLLYKPMDNLSARLTIAEDYNKSYDDSFIVDKSKSLNSISRDNGKNKYDDVSSYYKPKANSQAINISYELEKVKFESTTTRKKSHLDVVYDAFPYQYDGLHQYQEQNIETYTQEFKLSNKNQDIKWVTGLYFDKEDIDFDIGYIPKTMNFPSTQNSKTYAIFGQTMIPLGDSFELTLGGRYQRIKKDINLDMLMSGSSVYNYLDEKTWNSFLPKVAFTYKLSDNLSTYISFSKGYMPGGFNSFAMTGGTYENMFEPQETTNYEVGAKYIGDNFAINTAIFRMNIEDIHINKQETPGIFLTDNAEKAHSQGIEIDGRYFITDNLSISGAIGLVQSKYDDYDKGLDGNYNGQRIENTPKYTANLGVSYLADSGIYGRVDFNARGKTNFFDGADKSMVEADGAIITNAKIGYKMRDFDIYIFSKNLTNENYMNYYVSNTTMDYQVRFNQPRQFGIGAMYKF